MTSPVGVRRSRALFERARMPVLALTLLAAIPRIVVLFDPLWLDEVMSLDLALAMDTWWDAFTAIHLDNNHYLNTLYIWLIGQEASWWVYRVPAVAAGIGAVALAGRIVARESAATAIVAALLLGFSFLMVHYSAEARGYAPALFFALASFALLRRELEAPRLATALAFGCVAALGLVSHLLFAFVYLPLFVWSASYLSRLSRASRRDPEGQGSTEGPAEEGGGRAGSPRWSWVAARLARLHVIPAAVLMFLLIADIRHLRVGGGAETPVSEALFRAVAFGVGAPVQAPLAAAATVVLAAIAACQLRALRGRASRREGVFYLFALVLPVATLWIVGPSFVRPRSFLLVVAFALLLLAGFLGRMWRSAPAARIAVAAYLTLFLLVNGWRIGRLVADGRGDYRSAVLFMADHTDSSLITVAGDFDYQVPEMLSYYSRYLPDGLRVRYAFRSPRSLEYYGPHVRRADRVEFRAGRDPLPEWYVGQGYGPEVRVVPAFCLESGGDEASYRLMRVFPKYGPSGTHWLIYRRSGLVMGRPAAASSTGRAGSSTGRAASSNAPADSTQASAGTGCGSYRLPDEDEAEAMRR